MISPKSHAIRVIGHRELLDRVPYSRVQIWRLERQDKFPRRVRLGPNRIGWLESEVDDWIRSRLDDREASNANLP